MSSSYIHKRYHLGIVRNKNVHDITCAFILFITSIFFIVSIINLSYLYNIIYTSSYMPDFTLR